ncbi:unnamed protein product, partial [Iphiclides podalirius]
MAASISYHATATASERALLATFIKICQARRPSAAPAALARDQPAHCFAPNTLPSGNGRCRDGLCLSYL